MDEHFIIVKIGTLKSKKNNKEYYILVLYSLTYEFDYRIFITKDLFDYLKNVDFRKVDINKYILKFYDKETGKFNYSVNSKDFLNSLTSVVKNNTSNK